MAEMANRCLQLGKDALRHTGIPFSCKLYYMDGDDGIIYSVHRYKGQQPVNKLSIGFVRCVGNTLLAYGKCNEEECFVSVFYDMHDFTPFFTIRSSYNVPDDMTSTTNMTSKMPIPRSPTPYARDRVIPHLFW